MEEQEQLKAFVSKINAKTKELRSQNTRLEAMVITHYPIHFTRLFILTLWIEFWLYRKPGDDFCCLLIVHS